MSNHIILKTIHGSKLYGLSHADSDHDIFIVRAGPGKAIQSVRDGIDRTEMGLDRFLQLVYSGSHQSCEALFSDEAEIHPAYKPMFRSIYLTSPDVSHKYRRTIKKFVFGDLKKRRHAVRLALNLKSIEIHGQFNPTLSDEQVKIVNAYAGNFQGDALFDKLMERALQ